MKKLRKLLSAVLLIVLTMSALPTVMAEMVTKEKFHADIRMLMDQSSIPRATEIRYDYPDADPGEKHDFYIEQKNENGSAMRIDISLSAMQPRSEVEWSAVDAWLSEIIGGEIGENVTETEVIAKAIDKSVKRTRRRAALSLRRDRPVWADKEIRIVSIAVRTPYFPELRVGDSGSSVKSLQEKLILLGFLTGKADGHFGEKTRAAVEGLERHIRDLEQDVIDRLPAEMLVESVPQTPVDGIADAVLQAYLYSDEYIAARTVPAIGDTGDAVRRIQNRLDAMGYLYGAPDGDYGNATARAVRVFRHFHGLGANGGPDEEFQSLLFSSAAERAKEQILSEGSKGARVRELQTRLRVLGFMNSAADGDYGAATTRGVRALQQYMLERDAMSALGKTEMADTAAEVNGIADQLLMDEFFSDEFPAIPERIKNGDVNPDVKRVQRRLGGLEYYFGSYDGAYGVGTENAIREFQKNSGLEPSGVAGKETLGLLFSQEAPKAYRPYILKISTDKQRVYAYGQDRNGEYTRLVRTMKCSTGKDVTPTPKGTFQGGTGPGARWHYFKKYTCWAQYAYYIDGDIMFHSVLYNEKNGPVTQSSVNNLGRKASHGCVRLSVADAKWIYNNCPRNTKIIVY